MSPSTKHSSYHHHMHLSPMMLVWVFFDVFMGALINVVVLFTLTVLNTIFWFAGVLATVILFDSSQTLIGICVGCWLACSAVILAGWILWLCRFLFKAVEQ